PLAALAFKLESGHESSIANLEAINKPGLEGIPSSVIHGAIGESLQEARLRTRTRRYAVVLAALRRTANDGKTPTDTEVNKALETLNSLLGGHSWLLIQHKGERSGQLTESCLQEPRLLRVVHGPAGKE